MSDDTVPATKADIGRIENRMQKLEGTVQKLENDVQRLDVTTQKLTSDIQRLDVTVQKLGGDVQRIEKKFDAKFERLYEADDQILAVLANIDKRLTPQNRQKIVRADMRRRKKEVEATFSHFHQLTSGLLPVFLVTVTRIFGFHKP